MKNPLLSIIVPVYNVESYLADCLDSIINQSFTDFELILIDDGSTDNSGKICDEYALKDIRVIVNHQKNNGVSSARNLGLDRAKGKYITFVDPDDTIEKDTYLNNVKIVNQNPDIDILQFPTKINFGTSKLPSVKVVSKVLSGEEEIFANWWEGNIINAYIWNKIFRRYIFNQIRFLVGHVSEDLLLVVEFSKIAKKVYISEEGCYHYRVRENSLSNGVYSLSKNLDLFIAQFKIYKKLYSFEHLRLFRVRAFSRVFRRLITTHISYPESDLNVYLDELKLYIPKWKDIIISKDRNEYFWILFVKILGLRVFLFFFCIYLKSKENLFS